MDLHAQALKARVLGKNYLARALLRQESEGWEEVFANWWRNWYDRNEAILEACGDGANTNGDIVIGGWRVIPREGDEHGDDESFCYLVDPAGRTSGPRIGTSSAPAICETIEQDVRRGMGP